MSETVIAPRPEWFRTLVRKYRDGEGHAFLLSGPGIHDIDASSYSLHANIYHIFGNKSVPNKSSIFDFDIVVRYDAHNGFRFLGGPEKRKADRDKFKELVEKTGGSPAPAAGIRGGISSGGGIASPQQSDILDRSVNPALAIRLIETALQQTEVRICIIFDEFQALCPRGDWDKIGEKFTSCILACRSWGLDFDNVGGHSSKRQWKSQGSGHLLIAITDDKSEISTVISKGRSSSGWIPVNVGFPTQEEREFYIERFLTPAYAEQVELNFGQNVDENDRVRWLAGATGGLTIRAIEDVRLVGERHRSLTRDMISRIINETIAEQFSSEGGSDYLQVINPTYGLSGYGLPAFLHDELAFFLRRFREGQLRNSNILMSGPPGTGKSSIAYAIAYELGYKCVHWSPALTQSKWVGDTEKQLQSVLNWVEANLPCMLFVDEIDVALTSRDGGSVDTSGVGSKMLSILMPWLEKDGVKGRLLFIGATNRPDNIDAAMRRRMQTVIPLLPPMTPEERQSIIQNILLREHFIEVPTENIPEDVIGASTHWYTQANLSVLVDKAATAASRRGSRFAENIAGWLRQAVSSYRVDTSRTEALSYLAASQASDLDMLPPGFQPKQQAEVKKLLRDIEDDGMGPSERGVR